MDKAFSRGGQVAVATGNYTGAVRAYALGDAINAATGGRMGSNDGITMMRDMPRDPRDNVAFGPSNALSPAPIDPSRPDTGRPEPRLNEYPVAWNIPGQSNRLVPWSVLRQAADSVDIMRRCISVRQEQLQGLEWSFVLDEQTVQDAYATGDGSQGRRDVEAEMRRKFLPEIHRLTQFWRYPWAQMGLSLEQWVNGLMEDHLVLDAVAIYPRVTYGGDVTGFELVDPTTIKLLIDYRGSRPQAPFPAYQQDLWGFPRGEFTAATIESTDPDTGEVTQIVQPGMTADQLFYFRENFRSWTPYGYSAVEQALISARIYLKRQGWMLAEYDDGSTPLTWLVPDGKDGNLTEQLTYRTRRQWEDSINDELSGQTRARHRVKVGIPGMTPVQMTGVDERYKPDYDMHLITMLAGHFGVTKTGLGFSETKGLGSTGLHEGQAAVQETATTKPDTRMVERVINELSRTWLKMPAELKFKYTDTASDDAKAEDDAANAQRLRGTITINEDRQRLGYAPVDTPEGDALMLISGKDATPLDGLISKMEEVHAAEQQALAATTAASEAAMDAPAEDAGAMEKAAELSALARWRRKRGGAAGRSFICKALSPDDFADGVPADVDFAGWVWVADDEPDGLINKDYSPWWPRDAKGRWVKRGGPDFSAGPGNPGKAILAGLREQGERDRAARRTPAERRAAAEQRYSDAGRAYDAAMPADRVAGLKTAEQRERLAAAEAELNAARVELDAAREADPTPLKPVNALPEVPKELGSVEEEAARLRATEEFLAKRYGEGWRDADMHEAHLIAHRRAEARLSRAKRAAAEPATVDVTAGSSAADKLRRAEAMYGTDRSKWPAKARQDAAKLDRQVTSLGASSTVDGMTTPPKLSDAQRRALTTIAANPGREFGRRDAAPSTPDEGQRRVWDMHERNRLAMFPRDPLASDPDNIKVGEVFRTSSGWAVVTRGEGTTARGRGSIQIWEGGNAYKREYSLDLAREAVRRDVADRHRFAMASPDQPAQAAPPPASREERAAALRAGMASLGAGGAADPNSMGERIRRAQEEDAREVIEGLADAPGAWVSMVDVRREMGRRGMDRGQQDIVLRRMATEGDRPLNTAPEENQKTLTDADHAAAVDFGAGPQHVVSIDPPRRSVLDTVRESAEQAAAAREVIDSVPGLREGVARQQPISHRGGTITPVAPGYGDPDGHVRVVAADGTDLGRRVDVDTAKLALDDHAKGKPQVGAKRQRQTQADRMAAAVQQRTTRVGDPEPASADDGPVVVRQAADATGYAIPTTPPAAAMFSADPRQTAVYDKLLDEGRVKHKNARQIVEQMEAHGWKLTEQSPTVSVTQWEAPDGRKMAVQFLTSDKPKFYPSGRVGEGKTAYKDALAHVVTPTFAEVGGPNIYTAAEQVSPGLGKRLSDETSRGGSGDEFVRQLSRAQRELSGYGSTPKRSQREVSASLREQANRAEALAQSNEEHHVRMGMADLGPSAPAVRQREQATQLRAIADVLDRQAAERAEYEAERDRRAAAPLDIRPTARSAKPRAAKATPAPAAEPPAAKLSKRQRDMAARFDQLAGEHASDPGVARWRQRAVDLTGEMEQVGSGVLAQREADSIREQMASVQDEFTHAMAGARAAAEVRAAGGDERAAKIANTRATLDSRARKVTDRITALETDVAAMARPRGALSDPHVEARKKARKQLADAKAERQRYLDRIENAERNHDTKLIYDADGKLADIRYEPPAAKADPVRATRDDALAAAPRYVDADDARKLDAKATAAIERYRGKDFTEINRELRAGAPSAATRRTVEQLDRAMDESRLTSDIEVHRGVGDIDRMFGDAARRKLTGAEWTDNAPQSTTTDPDVAERFLVGEQGRRGAARIVMRVPAGVGAIQLSDGRYEAELLLQRGLKMRVVDDTGPWRRGQKSVRTITVEVVPA